MNNICSWSSRLSTTWRFLKPVKNVRFTSAGNHFSDDLDPSVLENLSESKEKCANEVRLIGRVGADPVLSNKDGKTYARFSLATNTYWKSDGDDQHKTEWHSISVFDPNLVSAAGKYIKKGSRLYVSGRLTYFIDNTSRKHASVVLQNYIHLS